MEQSKPDGWPETATLPDLTDEQKAEQRRQLDLALGMGRGAAMSAFRIEPFPRYQNLAPATRTGHEVHLALAFLLAHGLITVADPEAYQRWFSLDYEIPEHLSDAEDLANAYRRGF
jgi:hypothetical protein